MGASVLLTGGWRAYFVNKLLLASNLAVFTAALSWFVLRVGAPGYLPNVETLAMLFRLESMRNGRLVLAMILFFASLAASFSLTFSAGSPQRVLSFSYYGFLTTVFFPVDLTAWFGLGRPLAAAATAVVLFFIAAALDRLVPRMTGRLIRGDCKLARQALAASACFVIAGCYFLVTSI
jgi:hypothetical protein